MKHNYNVFAIVMAALLSLVLLLQGVNFLHMMGFAFTYGGRSVTIHESPAWEFVEPIDTAVSWFTKIVSLIFIGVMIRKAKSSNQVNKPSNQVNIDEDEFGA